jgi:hypothetical protein
MKRLSSLAVMSLMFVLLPRTVSAENAQAAHDAITACMYFYGVNNVRYEFPLDDTRKVVSKVCEEPMIRYNVLMNPTEKTAYGAGKRDIVDYAKPLLDLFLKDYAKALTVLKRN